PDSGAYAATNTSLTDSSEDSGDADAPALGDSSASDSTPDDDASSDAESSDDGASEDAETTEPAEADAPVVGSVKEETEDGVTIAAISEAVDVPSGNPSVVGITYEGAAGVSFEVRQK